MLFRAMLLAMLLAMTVMTVPWIIQTKYRTRKGGGSRFSSTVLSSWNIKESDIPADIIGKEVKRWFKKLKNKGGTKMHDMEEIYIKGFLCGLDKDKYKLLFDPSSQQLGNQLYDHLNVTYSKSVSDADKILTLNKDAFNLSYINPKGKITNKFLNFIEYCMKKYRADSTIFAPYFVLCQSSGYGKSRLIKQLALQHLEYSWLYFCLRKEDKYGYPETPVSLISNLVYTVSAGGTAERAVVIFKKWIDFLCSQSSYPSWNEMESVEEPAVEFFLKSLAAASKKKSKNSTMLAPETLSPLIVVLDEASTLLEVTLIDVKGRKISLFRLLRRALSAFNRLGRRIMFILIDTNSRISEFSPPSLLDPSLRYGLVDDGAVEFQDLLPPYYNLNTADVLANYRAVKDDGMLPLFLLGRPLWAATCKTNEDITAQDMFDFARMKLYGGIREQKQSRPAAMLVPFAICANLKVTPASSLGGDLVATHMATLIGVSQDRTAVYIRYPSEPILAEVALFDIGSMSKETWIKTMDEVSKLFLQGSGAGDRGEFVGLILLLLAKSRAVKRQNKRYMSEEVPLIRFLETLFGVEGLRNALLIKGNSSTVCVDQEDKTYDPFLSSSFISVTHFTECMRSSVPFKQNPDEVLESLYMCRNGLVMPNNWKGADALIPVRTVGSSPSTSTYSVILVQFKNRDRDADYPDSATRKLSSEYVFQNEKNGSKLWEDVPCIRMYMQLGDDNPKIAARPNLNSLGSDVAENYYAMAAFGLTAQVYPCLDLADGADGENVNINNDLSDTFRKFLRPPEWLYPIPESDMNSKLKEEDADGVNQIVWRFAREIP